MRIDSPYMLFHATNENVKKVQIQEAGLTSYQAATKFCFLVFKSNWMHFLGVISIK